MARPFIEFIQSQCLNWSAFPARAGQSDVDYKLLSEDADTGEGKVLLRYPSNWHAPTSEICAADEEVFVLSGALGLAGRALTRRHYAYWPSGYPKRNFCAAPEGAVVIIVFSQAPQYVEASADGAPYEPMPGFLEHLDCFALPWDNSSMDPNISHLNAYRKNLRLAPDGMCRTYLLAGLPQGFPQSGEEPLERHPHAEEMFIISGDMPCSLGGRLAQNLRNKGRGNANTTVVALDLGGLVIFGSLATVMRSPTATIFMLVPVLLLTAFPSGAAAAAIQDFSPAQLRGRVTAIYYIVVNFIGLSFGAPLVAYISTHVFVGGLGPSMALVGGVLLPCAALLAW